MGVLIRMSGGPAEGDRALGRLPRRGLIVIPPAPAADQEGGVQAREHLNGAEGARDAARRGPEGRQCGDGVEGELEEGRHLVEGLTPEGRRADQRADQEKRTAPAQYF